MYMELTMHQAFTVCKLFIDSILLNLRGNFIAVSLFYQRKNSSTEELSYLAQSHTESNCGARRWTWTIWFWVVGLNRFTDAVIADLPRPSSAAFCPLLS